MRYGLLPSPGDSEAVAAGEAAPSQGAALAALRSAHPSPAAVGLQVGVVVVHGGGGGGGGVRVGARGLRGGAVGRSGCRRRAERGSGCSRHRARAEGGKERCGGGAAGRVWAAPGGAGGKGTRFPPRCGSGRCAERSGPSRCDMKTCGGFLVPTARLLALEDLC